MSSFSRPRIVAVLAALLMAACGSEPRQAGAQDLSGYFHKPKEELVGRAPVQTKPLRRFSKENPARILVIGDSLAQGFGIFLSRRVEERGLAAVVSNEGRPSTGLTRSDFYDWPSEFARKADVYRPDVVVVHFGSNDKQAIVTSDGNIGQGTDEWDAAYRQRVRDILKIAAARRAMVYWLGPAPDRNTGINNTLTRITPIVETESRAVKANYLPLSSFTAGANGEFVKAKSVDGRTVTIRSPDGSHFTGVGYYLVADKLLEDMAARMPTMFNPPKLELAGILQ